LLKNIGNDAVHIYDSNGNEVVVEPGQQIEISCPAVVRVLGGGGAAETEGGQT
jgi:hypothetical protein